MALTEDNGMVMPVAPFYGNGGNGNNNGFGGDGAWWLLVLFLFAFAGGWGGNGFGGGGGSTPYVVNNDVQRGFDQAAIMGSLNGITSAVSNGFANAELSRANGNVDLLQTLWGMQMSQQNCCCDTRAAITALGGTVSSEACETRFANAQNTRDVIDNANRNSQAILDKLCQLELDGIKAQVEAKNDKISDLERQLTFANMQASQIAQTAEIQRGQVAEVDALYQRLSNCPVPSMPVYGMQPIFTCNGNNGCGCGGF